MNNTWVPRSSDVVSSDLDTRSDPGTRSDEEQTPRRVTDPWPQRTIYFRFGSRIVCATGKQTDSEHPNVLRLSIIPSIVDRVFQALLYSLPLIIRSWVEASYPEWLLSANIVLKRQKDGWEEEFDNEEAIYKKLKCLQGVVIPIYYGTIEYDGLPALILSDIGGACVAEPKGAVLSKEDLKPLLRQAMDALASCSITHDDVKLDNFHLVGEGRNRSIMVVDLERVNVLKSKEDLELRARQITERLMGMYRNHLECLREDGLLLPRETLI